VTKKFRTGELCFRLKYADKNMAYPIIDSLVCLGKDVVSGAKPGAWVFEFAGTYGKHGAHAQRQDADHLVVEAVGDDLNEILSLDELIVALKEASARQQ
jgi:hypothetical protein